MDRFVVAVFVIAVPFAIYKGTGQGAVIALVMAVVVLLKPKTRFLFWPKLK